MDYDSILGISALGLNYESHMAGFDGEDITYSVYYEGELTDVKFEETKKAISDFQGSFDEDDYPGFIDVANRKDKVRIHLDLGNTKPETGFRSMQGILKALNTVDGISRVILNENLVEGEL